MVGSRIVKLAALGMVVLGSVEMALADVQCVFTTIDVPGAVGQTSLKGINNSGQIIAFAPLGSFIETDGQFTPFNYPATNVETVATGINDTGQIVGYAYPPFPAPPISFVDTGGVFTTISYPGATYATVVNGINNKGQIVGKIDGHGFVYNEGVFTIVDAGPNGTSANGINDSGQIVGSFTIVTPAGGFEHGFLYTGGSFLTIDFPGAGFTNPTGINDSGQIVGYYGDSAGIHGFVGTAGSFTTIDYPGMRFTYPSGINNNGQIVGSYLEESNMGHGFLALSVPPKPPSVSCTAAPNTLWPPNGSSVPVTISGTVTGGTLALAPGGTGYTVSDEYGQVQPSGSIALGAGGSYSFAVSLIAARDGNDKDGRTYTIVVNSQDVSGKVGSCSAVVTVPHDQGN